MSEKKKNDYPIFTVIRRVMPMVLGATPGHSLFNTIIGLLHSISWAASLPIAAAFFDSIERAVTGRETPNTAILMLAAYGGMLVIQQLLNGIHNFHTSNVIFAKQRGILYKKIHGKASRIDPVEFESPSRLDDINKAREGADGSLGFTFTLCGTFVFYLPYLLFILFYLYRLNPILALSIPIIFVPAFATLFIRSVVFAKFEDIAAPHRRRYEAMEKSIADRDFFKETRVLGAFRYFHRQYRDALALLNRENWKAERKTNLWELALKILTVFGYCGVLYLLVTSLLNGFISIGSFAAVLNSIMMVVAIVDELVCRHMTEAAKGVGKVRNFLRFIDAPERTGNITPRRGENGVKLINASFRYPGADNDALSGINLNIQPGETVAIVGGNGAGKTTLVRLITGVFLPTGGNVLLRGVETRDINPGSLYKDTAAVFQKYQRYRMTLKENVAIGDTAFPADASLADESLRRADLEQNNESFPMGLDTMLSREFDGVDLSGGQWQRIAIARSFYREHDLIVLDEPTAAIDPIEEQMLYEKFAEISKEKTAIIVTHRLGSARIADRIIVMDEGRIDSIGVHDELMAAGGLYAEMFNAQAQWYSEHDTKTA